MAEDVFDVVITEGGAPDFTVDVTVEPDHVIDVVTEPTIVVDVAAMGTPGPQGPPGPPGTGTGLPNGGTIGQTITKTSSADGAVAWHTLVAADIPLSTTAFDKVLDPTITNAQLFADRMDEFAVTGVDVPIDPSGFGGNLDGTVTNAQLLAEAVDALSTAGTGTIVSVNGDTGPDVILSAADVGAVDLLQVGAASGVAPLDIAGKVPTTNLPDFVWSINSLSGIVNLDAAAIPLDDSGFTGSLVGITDVQAMADLIDTGTIGGGGGGGPGVTVDGYAFHATQTETLITDPTNPLTGSPFFFTWSPILNYANPIPVTGMFGPRAAVQIEGRHQYNRSTAGSNFTAPSFGSFLRFRNQGALTGPPANTINPGWTYIAANQWQADGVALTMNGTDVGPFHAAFVDSSAYFTTDGGAWNGPAVQQTGFSSQPFFYGNTTIARRVGYQAIDINTYPADLYAAGLWTDLSNNNGDSGNVSDPTNISVGQNIGFYCKRMTIGTAIYAAVFDGVVDIYTDTNTFTSEPVPRNPLHIGGSGNHTLDYANASIDGCLFIDGTWTFKQAAGPFGMVGGVTSRPTIQNHSSFTSGALGTVATNASFGAIYQAVNATNISIGTVTGVAIGPTFTKIGSGTLAITTHEGLTIQPSVNAGATVGTINSIHIKNQGGGASSAAIGAQTGILIDTLASAGANYGIINLNPSILQGAIYGGIAAGSNLVLRTSSGPTYGDIQLDNPETELVVTDYTSTGPNAAALFLDATITLNSATANTHRGYWHHPKIQLQQSGLTGINGVGANCILDSATYTNVGAFSGSLGAIASWSANPNVQVSGAATVTSPFVVMCDNHAFLGRAAGATGTLTVDTYEGVASHLSVNQGATVTDRKAFHAYNPNTSGTAGVLHNNYGLYIDAQTFGDTVNWGIYNLATSYFGDQATFAAQTNIAVAQTYTTSPTLLTTNGVTQTMNVTSGTYRGVLMSGPVAFNLAGNALTTALAFNDQHMYRNVSGVGSGAWLGPIQSYSALPTIRADGATITNSYYAAFLSNPTLNVASSGVLTATEVNGFVSAYTGAAGTTATTRRGLLIQNASLTGGAAITVQYGIEIQTLSGAAFNIGMLLGEGMSIQTGTSTGSNFGMATNQKIGFYGKNPCIVQPSGAAQVAVASTAPTNTTPFGYTTSAQAAAIVTLVNEIRNVLVNLGLMKGSA